MHKLKLLCLLVVLLCLASAAHAQNLVQYNGFVAPAGFPFGPPTIAVCASGGSGGPPCTPLVLIYTDASGTKQQPNPFTLNPNGNGNFTFFAACGTTYALQSFGSGYTTTLTSITTTVCSGGGGGGSFPISKTVVGTNGAGQIIDATTATLINPITVVHNPSSVTITGATPAVSGSNVFVTGNGGATTITNFTGGVDSQSIAVDCGDANTTIANNTNIVTFTGSNITCAVGQAYQFTFYGGTSKWIQTSGGGGGAPPNGANGDLQCKNGSNLLTCGNVNNATAYAQYVSTSGNDNNNGLSPETAKATIYKAMQALPNGSTGVAGNGTIYCLGTCNVGSPVSGGGIWLMGSTDPNFASPPAGWLKANNFAGWALKIEGVAGNTNESNARAAGAAQINDCGIQQKFNPTPPFPPCVWLSSANGFSIENINFQNFIAGQYMLISIDSNRNRNGLGGSQGHYFRNVGGNYGGGTNGGGNGPCIDIGSNTFWVTFEYVDCGGGEALISGSLSRSGGVVTLTSNAVNDLFVGEAVTVWNASDPTFNGIFTVTSVSGTPQTVATWNQTFSPNATATSSVIWTERMYMINIDAGTGSGSGAINVRHINTGGGTVRAKCSGGNDVDDIFVDAPFALSEIPIELYGACDGHAGGKFTNIQLADVSNSVLPGLINWSYDGSNVLVQDVEGVGQTVSGTATVMGADGFATFNSVLSPHASGQAGFFRGHLWGQEDAVRRNFTPVAARFQNIILPPSQWTTQGNQVAFTLTPGITAPDGTTGAYQVTAASLEALYLGADPFPGIKTLAIGDYYVAGAWIRPVPGSGGFSSNPYFSVGLNGVGFGAGDFCTNGQQSVNANAFMVGDGQWQWMTAVCVIATNPSQTFAGFGLNVSPTPVQIYAPVFYHITVAQATAAGFTNSSNEFAEWLRNLSTTASAAAPGDVAPLSSQLLAVTSGTMTNPNVTALNTLASARRTVSFPDASGTVAFTANNYLDFNQLSAPPSNPPAAGCRLYALVGGLNAVSNTGANCLPTGGGGGGNVTASGANNGQLAVFTGPLTITGAPLLPTPNVPGFTGDATNAPGSLAMTVGKILNNTIPSLSPGWLNWDGSLFHWNNPPTNVTAGATIGDVACYSSSTVVADCNVVGAQLVTNSTNFANNFLVMGTGNHTTANSTIAVGNVTQITTPGTTNFIPKFSSTNTIANSAVSDNGTIVTSSENVDIQGNALVHEYGNSATGTTLNKLVKFTGSPASVITTSAGDTGGTIGICTAGCTTTGNAQIADTPGIVLCVFDGGITARDYVQISAGTLGDCTDAGAARPTSGQIIGRVLSATTGSAGTYSIMFYGPDISAASGGGGSGTITTSTTNAITYYCGTTTVCGLTAPTSPNNVPQFIVSTPSGGVSTAPQAFLGGVPVNSTLGATPYTMATTDRLSMLQNNPSTPFGINLPNGGTAGFGQNFASAFRNYGTAVLSLSTVTGISLNGVAGPTTLNVLPNWTAWMWQDGSNNLWLSRVPTVEALGSTCANGLTWDTANNFGCLSAGPVKSGDAAGGSLSGTYPNPTIANNAVANAQLAVVQTRRSCDIAVGDASASAITSAQLGPQKRICKIPYAATVVEVDVAGDSAAGSSPTNVIVQRNRCTTFTTGTCSAETAADLLSAALAIGITNGWEHCSNTGGTTGLDGGTTCSATLQNTAVNAGDWIQLKSGTADGITKLLTVHVVYTVN